MPKKQLEEISNLLLAYSAGEYHVKGAISERVDELDMIISGINMLGEELIATNVSRDFFSSIFNSVSDYVFIVGEDGLLIDANETVLRTFSVSADSVKNRAFESFFSEDADNLFKLIQQKLVKPGAQFKTETTLLPAGSKLIYGSCTCTKLFDRFEKFNGYLVNIKDITEEKEKENLILRTIISTQQNEQRRVADDLHDSLGQELSMAQLMLANLSKFTGKDQRFNTMVATCTEILESSVKHLREICFDLMPSALVKGGLTQGTKQLVERLRKQDQIEIEYTADSDFPRLNPDLEIATYRIVQEFINNMIKHARATKLSIQLLVLPQQLVAIRLKDNGRGFDLVKLKQTGDHRGLQNIQTKIKAYGGTCEMNTAPGKGTELVIHFPLKGEL
ncbi:MAG: PAS domain S-box protein [Bacteroidetes bacterium]|nr:PAS domain S-box protein [Bacteroidota bacterium]